MMVYNLGMGGHGYGGAGDASSGFHGGHFVHMRGLPFRATENDIANVSVVHRGYFLFIILGGGGLIVAQTGLEFRNPNLAAVSMLELQAATMPYLFYLLRFKLGGGNE